MKHRNVDMDVETQRYYIGEDFLLSDEHPTGRYEIIYKLPIFVDWFDKSSDTTLVCFSAAVSKTGVNSVPIYSGRSFVDLLRCNVLLISDPSLWLNKKCLLGWYAGNLLQPDLQFYISKIIASFAQGTRVVFFGGSGGGFAALEQALRFENSIAVVSNPQTDIRRFWYFNKYIESVWNDDMNLALNNLRYEILTPYSCPVSCKVLYIQNEGDYLHIANHMEPLMNQVHVDNQINFYVKWFGEGHVGLKSQEAAKILSTVIKTNSIYISS